MKGKIKGEGGGREVEKERKGKCGKKNSSVKRLEGGNKEEENQRKEKQNSKRKANLRRRKTEKEERKWE